MNGGVFSDDQITAISRNPANSFLVDTQRGDGFKSLDSLPRAHLAPELRRPALAGHLDRFDTVLLAFMIATAVLGFLHRHVLTLFAFPPGSCWSAMPRSTS